MHDTEYVQRSIHYMNENLMAELSLETLAEHVHCSPYHFHRLFLLHTGETPMTYVRRLRLRAASRDLLASPNSLIEIAAKYGFESPDGFGRAFKRYYGLTPNEYRKRHVRWDESRCEEAITLKFDRCVYEQLSCSREDKREVLDTLDLVIGLSEKAKHAGLLSLESDIDQVQPALFKNKPVLAKGTPKERCCWRSL